MVVFKPLQEPSLSSVQVLDRVGNNGCVWGTIHGSENEVRAPPGADYIVAQVSPGPSTALAKVPLLGGFGCLLCDSSLPSPPLGGQ